MEYKCLVLVLLIVVNLTCIETYTRGRARYKAKKCEKITIPLCQKVGYNLTYMPNRFGHKTQFDAGLIIHQFWPLVLINCSPMLNHFVCSLYAPMCDSVYFKEIVPCRSFCEDVRDSCSKVMQSNGFTWPEHLKCEQFPTRAQDKICMKPGIDNTKGKNATPGTPVPDKPVVILRTTTKTRKVIEQDRGSGCGCLCTAPFVYPNRTLKNDAPKCALPCKKYFFSDGQMNFITFWLGLWSIIALVATILTTATFLIDRSRFAHTERPIIIISFCYILVAFGYIIRLIYGHESIACNGSTNLIRYSATGPVQCTAVFFLTYFFTNVAWIWWVVLSINWFLSTGLKWPNYAISCYSQYFHFIAWIIPTVQTMAILAMAAIDGDPVSGICSVGNHDNNTLTIFVIAPLLIYTMLAFSFFVAGVVAVCQSKKVVEQSAHALVTDNNKNIQQCNNVSKIGVFTFMLFIPAFSLIAVHFYEHNNKELWEKSTNCPCMKDKLKPHFYVFVFKYFMSLMIGLQSGFWILEARTLKSWKCFLHRFGSKERFHENNNLMEQKYHEPVSL